MKLFEKISKEVRAFKKERLKQIQRDRQAQAKKGFNLKLSPILLNVSLLL